MNEKEFEELVKRAQKAMRTPSVLLTAFLPRTLTGLHFFT